MGHDVWIITSKYGRERESEGHVIRLGTGWAAPANGSVGRVTLGLRFKHQAREVLERSNASTSSTSTSRSCRSCRRPMLDQSRTR